MPEKLIQKQYNRFQKGMTFTEVLVATVILAFAMIPILQALTRAHAYSILSEHKSKSLIYAQNQIEELRAQAIGDYDSFWSVSDISQGDGYYCSISANSDPALRTVTVTAGFDVDEDLHLDTDEILIELQTLIANQQ